MATRDEITSIACTVKDSLLDSWSEGSCFTDEDKMRNKGMMSEAIGLTSMLLIGVSFDDEPSFWNDGDKEKYSKIVSNCVDYLYSEVSNKGFIAEPLVTAKASSLLFNKDSGYVDTITWVLSSMILTRYSQRKGIIEISQQTKEQMVELIAKAFGMLLSSQRDDGTWGFMTDPKSKIAIYFTYSANATIADFFDYIVGEIESVEVDSEQAGFQYRDEEVLNYLNSSLGYDVEARASEARRKTATWLVRECIPLLSKLSECIYKEGQDYSDIGIWEQRARINDEYYDDVNFIQLYYVYYIIDMLTLTYSDDVFKEIIADPERLKELSSNYAKRMPKPEIRYFFKEIPSSELYEQMYKAIVEQSIQAARNNFMIASRTGNEFWISEQSELRVQWDHEDEDVHYNIQGALNKARDITDPALVPMSLRANTCFCYYISNEKDFSLDRLYQMIIDSRAKEDDAGCRINLWDDMSYNLQVTERCIEAIVDYHDYILKFGEDDAQGAVEKTEVSQVVREVSRSDLDLAVEKKIEEYLAEHGVPASGASGSATSEATAAMSQEAFNEMAECYLRDLFVDLDNVGDIYSAFDEEHFLRKLLDAWCKLKSQAYLREIKEQRDLEQKEYSTGVAERNLVHFLDKKRKLDVRMIDDYEDTRADLVEIYENMKTRR